MNKENECVENCWLELCDRIDKYIQDPSDDNIVKIECVKSKLAKTIGSVQKKLILSKDFENEK